VQRGKYKFVVIKDGERFRKKIRAPSSEVAEQSLARKGYRVVKLLAVLEAADAAQVPPDHATTMPEPPSDPEAQPGERAEGQRAGSADDLGPSGGGAVLVAGVLLVIVAVVVLILVGPWRGSGEAAADGAADQERPSADLIGGSAASAPVDAAEPEPDAGRGQREPIPRR